MSNKAKARRAAFKARQEKKAKRVIACIFGALIIFALIFLIYTIWLTM